MNAIIIKNEFGIPSFIIGSVASTKLYEFINLWSPMERWFRIKLMMMMMDE